MVGTSSKVYFNSWLVFHLTWKTTRVFPHHSTIVLALEIAGKRAETLAMLHPAPHHSAGTLRRTPHETTTAAYSQT